MSGIVTVKQAIINLLKNDPSIQKLLPKDRNGRTPVYHGFIQHKIFKPCITVEDVMDQAEVSGLNDSYDGSKRYSWQFAVIQIDCWSDEGPEKRDKIASAVQKCLLKNTPSGVIYCHEPVVTALDEPDAKPPLWRKSIRYHVMYTLEV